MMLLILLSLITMTMTTMMLLTPMFISLMLKKWSEKNMTFECGMTLNNTPRMSFSIRFFLLMVLFIIFDVEIILLLAMPMLTPWNQKMSMFIILFIMILYIALMYEWMEGSLNWKM